MSANLPFWPLTKSKLLGEFKAAMLRRSKAIKYHLSEWRCDRLMDQVDSEKVESLLVDFDLFRPSIRVRLWEDGEIWFYVREMRSRRVIFELSFYASLDDHSAKEFVSAIENSFIPVRIRESNKKAYEDILAIWKQFNPYDVFYGRL